MALPNHRKLQIGAVALAAFLSLLIFFAPRMRMDPRFANISEDEAAVTLALNYMESQQGPMKGIKMLDRITELHPENLIAIHQLAEFSMQTRQYGKAVDRYRALIKGSDPADKSIARLALSDALLGLGDTAAAIKELEIAVADPLMDTDRRKEADFKQQALKLLLKAR